MKIRQKQNKNTLGRTHQCCREAGISSWDLASLSSSPVNPPSGNRTLLQVGRGQDPRRKPGSRKTKPRPLSGCELRLNKGGQRGQKGRAGQKSHRRKWVMNKTGRIWEKDTTAVSSSAWELCKSGGSPGPRLSLQVSGWATALCGSSILRATLAEERLEWPTPACSSHREVPPTTTFTKGKPTPTPLSTVSLISSYLKVISCTLHTKSDFLLKLSPKWSTGEKSVISKMWATCKLHLLTLQDDL